MAARRASKRTTTNKTEIRNAGTEPAVTETETIVNDVAVEEKKPEVAKAPENTEEKKAPKKKTTTTKRTTRKTTAKKEEKAETKKTTTTTRKRTTKKVPSNVYVEYYGVHTKIDVAGYEERIKDIWLNDWKRSTRDLKNIDLYIKPEDGKVYFVINGTDHGAISI